MFQVLSSMYKGLKDQTRDRQERAVGLCWPWPVLHQQRLGLPGAWASLHFSGMESDYLLFSRSVVSDSLQPMDCSTPGFPALHHLTELAQTHVHRVGDAIQPSHPLSSPSPPAFNLSQLPGFFQRVSSSHQVAKVLELQHQSFQWIFRTDFL